MQTPHGYSYHGDPEEKAVFTPPEDISFVDFVEKYIVLATSISSQHGPKRISVTPALRPVYEALGHPDVREVDCRKSAQLAVTSMAFDLIAYYVVQKPRPIVYFLPDQLTAEKVGERLRTTLRLCKPVADLIIEDRFNKSEMIFKNGASVTLAWGSSIAQTGSSPYGLVIIDEADKPGYNIVGAEGSSLGRIRERCVTFNDYLIFLFSTPTLPSGNVSAELDKCHIVVKPFVPCPSCGHKQPLFWRRGKDDQIEQYIGMDGEKHNAGYVFFDNSLPTKQEKADSARYVCGECGATWTTLEKNEAVSRCVPWPWKIERRMGFDHLSRLYSLFHGGRLESMVASWLDSVEDISNLQAFINSVLGQVWITHKAAGEIDELKKAKSEILWQVVPEVADCITVAIDMQQTGFWYSARAWSSRLKDSWLIECGQIADWDEVEELFFERTWRKDSGQEMGCWRGALDVGGTKEEGKDISRTEEAEAWWVDNRRRTRGRVFLCKGSSKTSMPTKISIGKILETTPSGKKIAHGGLQIVELNTVSLKDLFFHALDQAINQESGAAFLSSDTPDAYFKHITAEAKDHDGTYIRLGRDNHWLDCEMMHRGLASRELHGGIEAVARRSKNIPPTQKQPEEQKPVENKPVEENPYLGRPSGPTINPYLRR